MASIRIAMAQFDFPVGDVAGNTERIIEMIGQARDEYGAELVMFPELAVSGYPPEDLLLRPGFLYECEQAMGRIAAACRGITAVVGWPQAAGAVVYNAASVLRDGLVEQTYRKRELPNYAVFDERRYFDVDPDGGSCVFEVNGIPVGLLICEDLWFAEPLADTMRAGAQLVVVPNASPYERGKHAQRDAVLAARTRESGAAIAYLNVVGGQDALVFDGASVVADGDGTVHPAAAAFVDQWLVVEYDGETRRFMPHVWMDDGDESMDALAWRAVTRGIQDYCRKNGFKKVWLGLSGGIDSAIVLAMAVDAMGAENVTAVRLPSRYTAGLSNDLAAEQCQALGVKLEAVSIEPAFKGLMESLAPMFEGTTPDVTEENLQSRSRGVILMALANKFGGLLLTTGNKSEYAVGYATIYGDMCGGYAPLKDLYKTEVFGLSKWRNTVGGAPVIPPAVISRPPSAELRENQLDQDSLPAYDVLDGILYRYIDQEQSRTEIVAAGYDAAVVDRVLRLVRISEWKRHQAAPGPKVSRRAFGRERRYPISNGYKG
ncbi:MULTISPECIES: NAD+ synthase [Stenotrophomonas]|jgi:NAD+ synthase (glutamine-hydrolysing)|uniref:Glutamine-dependent NAD(+) synthetase n=3 Tax=Gammaproteobacteria TaxID=1236 RepID=A0AAI9C4J8_STEMA|nr:MULTISPECIES: NAD+ synthase [Stenotrophomonas]AWT15969.1 NAD+ synthase [Stenotrophomonas maltophilia]EKT4094038.1 NAD+ synthase [Stenotrophomonas maltophilia]MBA0284681.1 NAD+ synthase [Stenotrophomonas maltophilia]MBA0322784.1 NAD+ synthase [Stenotrophomonas maltophilia]MBA0362544.1 NAD+ synthase [Stenotrophomonas maltophilia]